MGNNIRSSSRPCPLDPARWTQSCVEVLSSGRGQRKSTGCGARTSRHGESIEVIAGATTARSLNHDVARKEVSLEVHKQPAARWSLNLMVSPPVNSQSADGTSKSAVSRIPKGTQEDEGLAHPELDLLVIRDGLHVGDHVLVAAIGVNGASSRGRRRTRSSLQAFHLLARTRHRRSRRHQQSAKHLCGRATRSK